MDTNLSASLFVYIYISLSLFLSLWHLTFSQAPNFKA